VGSQEEYDKIIGSDKKSEANGEDESKGKDAKKEVATAVEK